MADIFRGVNFVDADDLALDHNVVKINRCAAVVKGGRRFSFSALVVLGDGKGCVGFGFGKAKEVPMAVEKAEKDGRKRLVRIPLVGATIPHAVTGRYGSTRVFLGPARPGTGVTAGPAVRALLGLGSEYGLRPGQERVLSALARLADRVALPGAPAVQACQRVGLPGRYAYRRPAR